MRRQRTFDLWRCACSLEAGRRNLHRLGAGRRAKLRTDTRKAAGWVEQRAGRCHKGSTGRRLTVLRESDWGSSLGGRRRLK